MIGEIGQLALCLALALSIVQVFAGFIGGAKADERLMAASRSAAIGTFVFISLAFAALITAYVVSDFSVSVVAANSHTTKPLLYKISGAWGNHEGSMILWLFILGLNSAVIAATLAGGSTLNARALGVQALVAIAFLVFVLLTSDPFLRIYPPPFEGAGLNPLLQDPGLAIHPPLLYLGYVGMSATFSFAAAALVAGSSDATWVRAARPFALAAWSALTCGIALGSWWAYYELGWGGFWFWDPVENASLMPWLIGTALIHSMMATERTGAFKSWTLLLATAAFSFSLIGTFLVRSGVLTSVHAFANDPERGKFILGILALAVGAPLTLFAIRAPTLKEGAPFKLFSRDAAILVNNLLLTGACATVFIGTIYPLALEAISGAKISVGPPYFALTFVPIFAVLGLLVPFGPLLGWRQGDVWGAARMLRYAMAIAVVAAFLVFAVANPRSALGAFAIGAGVWLIASSVFTLRRRAGAWRSVRLVGRATWAVVIAHAGLGVVAFGVAGTTVWRSEAQQVLNAGQSMDIAGYTLHLDKIEHVQGPNYTAERGLFTVFAGGREITRLDPEKRTFPVEGQTTTESAIHTTILSDLYVVMGEPRGEGWIVRAYVNPLAPFIWLGAFVMAIGGVLALSVRVKPMRETRAVMDAAPAE